MNALLQSLELEWGHPKSEALSRAPLYHQLYTMLKAAIMDGRIGLNEKLPTEDQLVQTFDVSRVTAKRAMSELVNENLIVRSRGRGSHVIYQYEAKPLTAPLLGMLESYAELARHSKAKVISIEQQVPRAKIRDELGTDPAERVLKIVRVHSNEQDVPYSHYTSWTPRVATDHFSRAKLEQASRLIMLRESGVELHRATQTLSAEAASNAVAAELGLAPAAPLLSMMRRSYDRKDSCVDIIFGLYNPKLFKYAMELNQSQ